MKKIVYAKLKIPNVLKNLYRPIGFINKNFVFRNLNNHETSTVCKT
jgi:hypothetical protein